jgi:hypothetical protein
LILVNSGLQWITPPTLEDVFDVPLALAGQAQANRTFLSRSWLLIVAVNLIAVVPILAFGRDLIRRGRSPELWPLAVIVLWGVIPVLGSFVLSFAFPMFLPRYLIVSVPAIALLTAVGLLRLPSRLLSVGAFATICAVAVAGLGNVLSDRNEDFRGATAYIQEHATPTDGLIVFRAGGASAYAYYAERDPNPDPEFIYPESGDPIDGSDTEALFSSLRRGEVEQERIWLMLSHYFDQEEFEELRRLLTESGFETVSNKEFWFIDVELLERDRSSAEG